MYRILVLFLHGRPRSYISAKGFFQEYYCHTKRQWMLLRDREQQEAGQAQYRRSYYMIAILLCI